MGSLDFETGSEAGLCVARGLGLSEPWEARLAAKWLEGGPPCGSLHPIVGLTPGRQDSLACLELSARTGRTVAPSWSEPPAQPGQGGLAQLGTGR